MSDVLVDVSMAFKWLCPKCKDTNYVDAVEFDPDSGEVNVRGQLELEDWQELPDIPFLTYPDVVICETCSTEFMTTANHENR